MAQPRSAQDVFSAHEIARAAGVQAGLVAELIRAGRIPSVGGQFVTQTAAVAAVRRLRAGMVPQAGQGRPFQLLSSRRPAPGRGLAASAAAHAAVLGTIALLTAGAVADQPPPATRASETRLVFVASPGPGGGGGGGGLRQASPPQKARVQGRAAIRSPVPPPRRIIADRPVARRAIPPPVRPRPVERPVEPPPPAVVTQPLPQVTAPLATIAADAIDRAGVLTEVSSPETSNGPGSGGGAGTGTGTGIGEGDGSGVGPGSGGGTGGGPYRPGAGITPPSIIREVKPDYPQDARRRGIEGDVVVEVIVRADGSVGQVRLLQGLGAGLDERAVAAVRQWRFDPARRHGTPVDVVVEIAVEFRMR
jgi:protein TonB